MTKETLNVGKRFAPTGAGIPTAPAPVRLNKFERRMARRNGIKASSRIERAIDAARDNL